jgi:hypothetical protein
MLSKASREMSFRVTLEVVTSVVCSSSLLHFLHTSAAPKSMCCRRNGNQWCSSYRRAEGCIVAIMTTPVTATVALINVICDGGGVVGYCTRRVN